MAVESSRPTDRDRDRARAAGVDRSSNGPTATDHLARLGLSLTDNAAQQMTPSVFTMVIDRERSKERTSTKKGG